MRVHEIMVSVSIPSGIVIAHSESQTELSDNARVNGLTIRATLGKDEDVVAAALALGDTINAAATALIEKATT